MKRVSLLVVAVLAAALSCERTTEPVQRVVRLDVGAYPVRPFYPVGDSAYVLVVATFSDGLVLPIGDAKWRSTDTTVATVSEAGLIRMVGRGTATIEASASDVRGSMQLVVRGLLHDAPIRSDEAWLVADTPHVVRGFLLVASATPVTITIEAGSRVLFGRRSGISFGEYGGPGRGRLVIPPGGAPTVFEGDSALPEFWSGIRFLGTDTTELRNVVLRQCGGSPTEGDPPYPCLLAAGGAYGLAPTLLMDDVTVDGAPGPAMLLDEGATIAAGSRLVNVLNGGGPIARIAPRLVGQFPLGGRYQGNAENAIWVMGGAIEDSTTWGDPGVPLTLKGIVRVGGPHLPVLTVPTGFHLRSDASAGFVVGETGAGALVAGDPAGPPVVLESTGNGWAGIEILASGLRNSLTNVELRDCAAAAGACLRLDGYPADAPYHLRDVTVRGSRADGVHLMRLPRFDSASGGLTVIGSAGVPLALSGDEVPFIPPGDYHGNDTDAVRVRWGAVTADATWHDIGMPYLLPEGLAIGNSVGPMTLTLDSGVVLRMGPSTAVGVGRTLRAIGTASRPVIFESTTPGVAGAWVGIQFAQDLDPGSLLDHTEVRDAGAGEPGYFGAIRFWMFDPGGVIRNTTIRRSANCGIVLIGGTWTDDYTDPAYGNAFIDVAGPAVCHPDY